MSTIHTLNPVERQRRMTQKRKILVWFGWLICAVVAIEVGLRIAHVSYPVGGKDLFFTWDPNTGVAPRPGAEGLWPTLEYQVPVHINSQGLRDREHALQKPPNTFRIAVLGDSYTEALQVPMEKDYSSVLEQQLTGCPLLHGQTVEVMNFGVNSFSTAQELLRLRNKVWAYSPDLVILAFDTGNNVFKNSRAIQHDPTRPYFVEKDGKLVLDDSFARVPGARARWRWNHFSSWAIKHSRLLQVIAAGSNYLRYGNIDGLIPNGMGLSPVLYSDPTDPDWQDAWRVSQDLIAEMHQEVVARGSKFLVLTLSSSIQVEPDPVERQKLMTRVGITDVFYPDHRIQQFAISRGIPVLNLAPYLQKYAEANQVHVHGLRSADHQGLLNELGHRVAGELIAQKVCEDILSGAAPTAVAAEHVSAH
jgi:hypothetical protein